MALVVLLFPLAAWGSVLDSEAIQIVALPDASRVTLRLTAPAQVRVVDAVQSHGCFFIDLYSVQAGFQDKVIPVNHILRSIRIQTYPKALRLQFFPDERTSFRVAEAETGYLYPLGDLTAAKFVPSGHPARTIVVETTRSRRWRVILDPGHGGKDPGAVSGKRREKDVVLAIVRSAQRNLSGTDVDVILTRKSDTYRSLGSRRDFVEEIEGDLFVSIHANAAHRKRYQTPPSGIEFYYLSKTASPDTAALAEAENREDEERLGPQQNAQWNAMMSHLIEDILREHRSSGARACQAFNQVFSRDPYFRAHNRGVKSAPFRVLTNRMMPAILVEVGYIDHPAEGRLLASPDFQDRTGRLLAQSIRHYLTHQASSQN